MERTNFGYIPDISDERDYTTDHIKIKPFLEKMGLSNIDKISLPEKVDLRKWCSEVKNQGNINSCTAFAGAAMLEYYERKNKGREIDASALFLYKSTRNLMLREEDIGATLRSTMKTMVFFGVPPEKYWVYDESKVNIEPPAFCYALTQNYQALKYLRLDEKHLPKEILLKKIKSFLFKGHPLIFGTSIYFVTFLTDFMQCLP